ncbi:MAG: DUF2628 domain-containing protein [Stappiaceae bacterium]
MAIYSVLVPPTSGDALKDSGNVTFIRDGFSWGALLIPILWILWNRMWWVFLGYLAIAVALETGAYFIPGLAPGIVATCFGLLFAFEANELKRWSLERKGWHFAGVVAGSNLDECEARFFSTWNTAGQGEARRSVSTSATDPAMAPTMAPMATPATALKIPALGSRRMHSGDDEVIGLFPTPETTR